MRIVSDMACMGQQNSPAKILENLLDRYGGYGRGELSLQDNKCKQCGKVVAYSFIQDGQATQLFIGECTRVVLGVVPEIREKMKDISYGAGDPDFICIQCNNSVPEMVAEAMPELKGGLGCNPIIDSPNYEEGKGCWITITEFLQGGDGRFLNAQLESAKFPIVVKISGLADLLMLST